MTVTQAGLPIVWDDCLGPAYAGGAGAASPAYNIDFLAETGGNKNEIRLPTFVATTDDRIYFTTQVLHNMYRPDSGNVVFKPHVHWTFLSEPTSSQTVIWELWYVYAKPNAAFQSSQLQLTATAYTTSADVEVRKHILTSLGDITIAAADIAPSMVFAGVLKLDSSSTIAGTNVGLLSFDFHYQKLPWGTVGEFS